MIVRMLGVLLVVCGLVLPLSGTALADTPAPPPQPFAGDVPATGPSADTQSMLRDESTAVAAVNRFWTENFQPDFHRQYTPPQVRGGYDSAAGGGPTCGGQPALKMNAFYCKPGDFLAWDQQLMSAGYRQIGNAWVYLIIAHEWGHSIQARIKASKVSVADELQADCFGAAALNGAVKGGYLHTQPSDVQQIQQTLAVAADKYPWTNVKDHGNAQQRTAAFNMGLSGGVKACVARKTD